MKNKMKERHVGVMVAILFLLSGCGLLSDGDHERNLAQDESVYQMGNPVPADGFDQSQTIILSVLKTDDSGRSLYVSVENGEYLAPNTIYSMAVTVSRRMVNGREVDQRYFH